MAFIDDLKIKYFLTFFDGLEIQQPFKYIQDLKAKKLK